MAEYNVPQNRTNWLISDLILAPALYVIAWVLLVKFGSFKIYEHLAQNPGLLEKIKGDAVTGLLSHRWIDLYILWYRQILGAVVLLVGILASFNDRVPGIGRQIFIPFRKWQINKMERTRGMRKLDQQENPTFPPMVRKDDPVYLAGLKTPMAQPGKGVLLGIRKRFKQDIEYDKRHKKRVEKFSEYEPLIMSKESRFRHALVVGGTGSGKTASIIGPLMQGDLSSSLSAVLCINPKGDEYLLRVAADPILARRKLPAFKRIEAEYQEAVRNGETRSFARWTIEVKNTSIKPFALISISHPELSLQYDPLQHGDADQITKKIIYSADTMSHEFYKARQESWLQSLMLLVLSDDDLRGRLGLRHIHWFTGDPKTRLGDALSGIVDIDAEVKFPHLATKIRRQREYERLINNGDRKEAEKLQQQGLLSKEESDKLLAHEENRTRLRNLMSVSADHLAGLSSHMSQLVEDDSISGIFTDNDRPSLDFREVMRCGGVVYVEVPTQSKWPQAQAIARMIMMEVQSYSADRDRGVESKKCDVFVFIDEFASMVYDGFINLIDKSRSPRVGITLAHQSLGNLEKRHLSASFKKEVLDNCNTKFILSVQDVETQKYFQGVLGKAEVLRRSVTEADSTQSGEKHGRTKGINRGFTEGLEYVVTEDELACKRGLGFARILEEDQSQWRGAVSLSYLPEKNLSPFKDVLDFLDKERIHHPKRAMPFYVLAQDGRLWDPVRQEPVRAGMAHHGKPLDDSAMVPDEDPGSALEQEGEVEAEATVGCSAPTEAQSETNDAGGAAPADGASPIDPRKFFLGE